MRRRKRIEENVYPQMTQIGADQGQDAGLLVATINICVHLRIDLS
jgi:hypothetical protein